MRATSTVRGVAATAFAFLHLLQGPVAAQTTRRSDARTLPVRGVIQGEDVIRIARRYVGVPYRMGGVGPKVFDCSGFVRYVFAQYGIVVPRTAHEQAALGRAPFPGDLRSGDLLFFYGGNGAQHIALYVAGDTIIHASSTGRRVRFDLLSREGKRRAWFKQRLIAVRRVAPLEGYFYLPTASDPPQRRPVAGARAEGGEPKSSAVVSLVPRW
ncbi:MAG: hypothetical protein NVS4B3_15500 [Gemmatimonadaceae bacterium]